MPSDLSVEQWNAATESWSPQAGRAGDRIQLRLSDELVLPTLSEGLLGVAQRFSNGMSRSVDAVYRQMDNIYAFYETNLQWDDNHAVATGSTDGSLIHICFWQPTKTLIRPTGDYSFVSVGWHMSIKCGDSLMVWVITRALSRIILMIEEHNSLIIT